jgi:hypothetical protein
MALGSNGIKHILGGGGYKFVGMDIVTPIHTSSHYQPFETPFTHDLVGGDRNMEQTNLVVTADGKTWDEVTRDTSYIGKGCVFTAEQSDNYTSGNTLKYDKWRGSENATVFYNKDFVPAYDRIICLKAGQYRIGLVGHSYSGGASGVTQIYLNGTLFTHMEADPEGSGRGLFNYSGTFNLKRGDQLRVDITSYRGSHLFNNFTIDRV